jgi:hypothetical protein
MSKIILSTIKPPSLAAFVFVALMHDDAYLKATITDDG